MKRIALGLMSVFMVGFLAVPVMVHGEETDGDPNEVMTTTMATDEGSDNTAPDKASREDRIKQRKEARKTVLNFVLKQRMKLRCKAAQGLIKLVEGRVKGIQTSRTQVHENLLNRLTDLSEKLQAKGINTTELDESIAMLKTKIDKFATDLAAFKEAVADLVVLDCQADPEGFKATLDTAREGLMTLRTDILAIRSYLKETIKPLLVDIRSHLDQPSNEGGDL